MLLLNILSALFLYGVLLLILLCFVPKKKRGKAIAIFTITVVAFVGVQSLMNQAERRKQIAQQRLERYGVESKLDQEVYSYHSPRSFHGDGYSLVVYKLPKEIRQKFETADTNFLKKHPSPSFRSDWRSQRWSEGPLKEEQTYLLDFATPSYEARQSEELAERMQSLKTAIKSPTSYFAYFAMGGEQSVGDIYLFVVDLKNNLIYEINHNT